MRQIKEKQEQKRQSTVVTIVSFFLKTFTRNMDAFALKFIGDYLFIIIEKIVVKLPSLIPPYITYYEDIVDNEISLVPITKQDTIIHIGCGPIPSTSLLFAQKTGARTIGIDKDILSVKDARYCVHVSHLENQIQIDHGDALTYAIQSSRFLIVSQGIEPRYNVLEHIAQSMRPDALVIFRTLSSKEGGITTQDEVLGRLFTVGNIVSHPHHGILISVVLSKKADK